MASFKRMVAKTKNVKWRGVGKDGLKAASDSFKVANSFLRGRAPAPPHSRKSGASTSGGKPVPTVGRDVLWEALHAEHDKQAQLDAKLRRACGKGLLMQARKLIDAGASVHSRDEAFERTPLHYAALHGHADVVKMLAARGSNPKLRDLSDLEPLHLAAERGWAEVISVLLEGGADAGSRCTNGRTALHLCAYANHTEAIDTILAVMVERRMLRVAYDGAESWRGRYDFSQFTDKWGQTPVDLARERGHGALVRQMETAPNRQPAAAVRTAEPPSRAVDTWAHVAPTRKWKGFGPVGSASGM